MSDSFNQMKSFFEQSQACKQALQPLKKGVEIGALLDESTPAAIGKNGDNLFVEQREAKKPDVIFKMNSEAIHQISNSPDDIGEIGIAVMKQVKAGNVKISVPGNLLSLLRNGYMEIIALGGKTIWKFLSDHGITNPAKVAGLIKKMKSRN